MVYGFGFTTVYNILPKSCYIPINPVKQHLIILKPYWRSYQIPLKLKSPWSPTQIAMNSHEIPTIFSPIWYENPANLHQGYPLSSPPGLIRPPAKDVSAASGAARCLGPTSISKRRRSQGNPTWYMVCQWYGESKMVCKWCVNGTEVVYQWYVKWCVNGM